MARRGFQGQELFGEADGCDKTTPYQVTDQELGFRHWPLRGQAGNVPSYIHGCCLSMLGTKNMRD